MKKNILITQYGWMENKKGMKKIFSKEQSKNLHISKVTMSKYLQKNIFHKDYYSFGTIANQDGETSFFRFFNVTKKW